MQPTVWRIVYYKSAGSKDWTYPSVNRAAIITEVWSTIYCSQRWETYNVSLCVINPTWIHFVQDVEQGQEPCQWDWMPFQKDQQKRYEGLNEDWSQKIW